MSYLQDKQVERVILLLPKYQWAMHAVGLEGEDLVLASLHYRESEFADHGDPGTGEGPFGCDQGGDGEDAVRNVQTFAAMVAEQHGYIFAVNDLDQDFGLAALCAAHEFKSKLRITPVPVPCPEDYLADGMWGYNGRSVHHSELQQTGQGSSDKDWHWSPYVYNDPAAGRTLNIVATEPDPAGGRRTFNKPDSRPGALIVYRELLSRMS